MEASPGIEPGYADLQSAASPLRHEAFVTHSKRVSIHRIEVARQQELRGVESVSSRQVVKLQLTCAGNRHL
jgi:hypothetical protein